MTRWAGPTKTVQENRGNKLYSSVFNTEKAAQPFRTNLNLFLNVSLLPYILGEA